MRWALATAVLLFASLSGCSADDSGETSDDGATGTQGTTGTGGPGTGSGTATSGTGTGSGTGTPARTVLFTAPVLTGSTPLNVTFSLGANGTDSKTQWRLSFGDGSQAQTGKGSVPASVAHVYSAGGNFTATFNVTWADGSKAGKALQVEAIAPPPPVPPDPVHFELGPSAGCAGDILELGGQNCVSFEEGPGSDPVDGHWIPLDQRYWGLDFTSDTTANPDSDCMFVAEDGTTILGNAHNGSSPCKGTVPELTAWLFIYPYAAPDPGMTVDFEYP